MRRLRAIILGCSLVLQVSAQTLTPSGPRPAIDRALTLLTRSAEQWFAQQDCVSCHQHLLPLMTFRDAYERGIKLDNARIQNVADTSLKLLRSAGGLDRAIQGSHMIDPGLSESYVLIGAHAAGMPVSFAIGARARFIAYRQSPAGYWRTSEHRPPLLGSTIASTAVTLRALQCYLQPFQPGTTRERVARAKDWLWQAHSADTEDEAFQLLGLHWAGTQEDQLRALAQALLREQRPDGGWAQLPSRPSDAYATGEALVALADAAGVSPSSPPFRRGLQFLLRTQANDGSWEVGTRMHEPAPGNPPYFESGFPYGHNQMISCAGTAWATMALLRAIPVVPSTPAAPFLSAAQPAAEEAWMKTALFGSPAALQHLLDNGLDPNSRTSEGTTLLMAAVTDPAKVQLLLDRGADVRTRAKSGYSALMVAANYGGSTPVVRLLLSRGAPVVAEDGVHPVFNASALLLAVFSGEPDKVAALMEQDHNLKQAMLAGGFARTTPMAFALYNADTEMIRFLAAAGADVNELQQVDLSPLSIAVLMGNTEVARTLIDLGADVNRRDQFGMTPLLWASLLDYGTPALTELLLHAGARRDVRNNDGLTARDLAKRYGQLQIQHVLEP